MAFCPDNLCSFVNPYFTSINYEPVLVAAIVTPPPPTITMVISYVVLFLFYINKL